MLSAVHLLGARIHPLRDKYPRRALSFAAGASIAYVFLDVLPTLGARHRALLESASEMLFAEQRLYVLSLAGFVVLYGLEHMVLAAHRQSAARRQAADLFFWLHTGGFALYGIVIGEMLVSGRTSGWGPLGLYTVAMVFHLTVVDHTLARTHPGIYDALGRWILAASVLVGWLVGVGQHLSELTVSRLFAFVAGGVVMTSANEELPRESEGRFGWFVLGAVVYGVVIVLAH